MVNYHVLNNSIVVNFEGNTHTLSRGDHRYEAVLAAIKAGKLEEIPNLVDIEKSFQGTGIEMKDGVLYESENPIPTELNDRILSFKEQGIPFDSLLKFWENLKKNPSFNARKMLFKFLEHNGHPLTQDGCFIAYRGVTEDFKDKQTGTFDNKPGSVCEMPRDQVDDNPNNTCSAGLHVACFDYAKNFGERLVEVKVNPADVVAVPVDYNGTKMRTCKFEVIQECKGMRTEQVYGDTENSGRERPIVNEYESEETDESDEETESTGGNNYCTECGEERDPFANFCGNCGHEHE